MFVLLMAIEDAQTRTKLEKIYLKYQQDMYVTAYAILKDHYAAEDIVQDAIINLSKNLSKISDIECKKTRSYLVIIVRNLAYNLYNKQKKIKILEDERALNIADDDMLIEEKLLKHEQHFEFSTHLKALNPAYADILTLRFYHELSVSEIAEALGVTTNNVSVKINRAIKAFKKVLTEEGVVND